MMHNGLSGKEMDVLPGGDTDGLSEEKKKNAFMKFLGFISGMNKGGMNKGYTHKTGRGRGNHKTPGAFGKPRWQRLCSD